MAVISIKNKTKSGSLLAGNPNYVPPSFESIATVTGNGSSTSLTFSSIPQTYVSLQIRGLSRNVSGNLSNSNLNIRFNSDSGSNYTRHFLRGTGSAVGAYGDVSSTVAIVQDGDLSWTSSSSFKAVSIIDIHDYASTIRNKTMRSFAGQDVNDSSGSYGTAVALSSALWLNTAAITSITITSAGGSAFDSTSVFSLYGIKGA